MMRLITAFELATKRESELRAIFLKASMNVIREPQGSPERRNALASLENIARALYKPHR